MYENFQNWIEETSTKKKEGHILKFLEEESGNDTVDNKRLVDSYLFDENNIPKSEVDINTLFDELDIDEREFELFIQSM
jgi:hypothetical protein